MPGSWMHMLSILGARSTPIGATFLNAVPASDRPRLRARVAELAAPLLRTADGSWRADYVRLRFRAWLGDDN